MAYITKHRRSIVSTGGFPVTVEYSKHNCTFHYSIANTSGLEKIMDSILSQTNGDNTNPVSSRPTYIDIVNNDLVIQVDGKSYNMTRGLCESLRESTLYLEGSVTFLLGTKYRSSLPVEQSHTVIAVVNGGRVVKY